MEDKDNNLKKDQVLIIAEIGNNHEGSFENAIKLIDEAANAKADAVKFQTFDTKLFISKHNKNRYNQLEKFELTKNQFEQLSIYSKRKGLKFISTPFDIPSALFLEKIVDLIKIASGDNNYFDLISTVSNFQLPLLISTGLLNNNDIKELLIFFKQKEFDLNKLSLLHCVSSYPVEDEDANLNSIKYMIDNFDISVGYSDHTKGIEACLISTALGAKVLEKHFTLDKNFSDFRDHKMSADPKEFSQLVKSVRVVEKQLGNYEKKAQQKELENLKTMRRSVYAASNLKKGSVLSRDDFKIVRPQSYLEPKQVYSIIGKVLKKDIREDEALSNDDFE